MHLIKCNRCAASFETKDVPKGWTYMHSFHPDKIIIIHLCGGCGATFEAWLKDFVHAACGECNK